MLTHDTAFQATYILAYKCYSLFDSYVRIQHPKCGFVLPPTIWTIFVNTKRG